MKSRERLEHNIVKAVDEDNEKETFFLAMEILLDIRDLLKEKE